MKRNKNQIKGGRVHRRQIRKRAVFAAACFSVLLCLLTARLYYIQVVMGADQLKAITVPGEALENVLKRLPVL